MKKLDNVTLICVDTLNHTAALNALCKSCQKIEFNQVLFLTDESNIDMLFGFRDLGIIRISKITSKEQYSKFIIKNLTDYCFTDYCLIIQYDGYIINPHLWNDKFLSYDYIGAAWWYDDLKNVGNGGFSIRSKKLLDACKNETFTKLHPEDEAICRDYRHLLEKKYQIKFAPEQLARRFSFEPNPKNQEFYNNTFGFHGIKNLILS